MKRLNRPVEMVSVFHDDCSYPKPVKFKHKLDNGKVIVIHVDKILSEKHRKWGELSWCQISTPPRRMLS